MAESHRNPHQAPGPGPQHRDHGPHRRGQDHHDRAHPLLHRHQLQDRRGPRGRRHHGLDAPGAGAGHHHHLRRHHLRVGRHPDQHHRHPRPRRLHGRGGAVAARPRRRRGGVRRRRRRGAPDRDGLAPGRQVRRAPDVLRQQDGPHRRRLLPLRRHDQGPPRRHRGRHPAADRRRERVPRRGRPHQACRPWSGPTEADQGREVRRRRHPGRPRSTRPSPTGPRSIDTLSNFDDAHHREVPRRGGDHRRRPDAGPCAPPPSPARWSRCCAARPSRTRASSPCSTPSSPTCRRRSTSPRPGAWTSRASRSSSARPPTTSRSPPWPSRS